MQLVHELSLGVEGNYNPTTFFDSPTKAREETFDLSEIREDSRNHKTVLDCSER